MKKPNYSRSKDFTTYAGVEEFVQKNYGEHIAINFSGDNSTGWFPSQESRGDELGFYSHNTGRGYAYYPKETEKKSC